MAGLLSEKINKKFVVLEGIDGSGKTLETEMLKKYFADKKRADVVFTFEHTRQGPWSEQIEAIVHKKTQAPPPAEKLQLLYILDRKDHIENFITPSLKKGKTVFCDRYVLSTLAYGSAGGDVHWKTLWNNHKEIIGDAMIMPAKTIFFDVPADIAVQRIGQRDGGKTIFESIEKLRKIRDAYLAIGPHFEGFEVIDGTGTSEKVFELLKAALSEYL